MWLGKREHEVGEREHEVGEREREVGEEGTGGYCIQMGIIASHWLEAGAT